MLDPTVLIFLSSGLFLGWSLGANDAANVFGTAVGSRMIRFTTAAIICGIFVILGAFVSGTGAAQTLGKLGAVNAIGGSFMAALAAGLAVYWMTKLGLPVSTSQAIIGSIIGWNLFSDSYTDISSLLKILSTWIICPLLSAVIAAFLFSVAKVFVRKMGIGLIRFDGYTRLALILAGAFGAYSLGANNIANVMGVFVPVAPFPDMLFWQGFSISSAQQLFLVGGLAIAVGVFTYSKRVMMTVGSELMTLTPLAAWVAVMSHSVVLFLFASERLEQLLAKMSLPTIPLVPVSSSQAVVGAVIGIGMLQGGREIHWPRVYSIVKGWVITPLISCLLCFVGLYFLQNVFQQTVQRDSNYALSASVIEKLQKEGIETEGLHELTGTVFQSSAEVVRAVKDKVSLSSKQGLKVVEFSLQKSLIVTAEKIADLETNGLSSAQLDALSKLAGQTYNYPWQLGDALAEISPEWIMLGGGLKDKLHDRDIKQKLAYLYRKFQRRER
ncbi:MAG: inorganic phosphate transporter [SAR324 cluster bacterium]|nr:anion permease [SAR324 cluster bacterium]MEC8981636.1 inorganic phosphate transporter [SAR324 cluster bacterium]MED5434513.1 inorganic phosphate transporter [SAR324 cluster bacterium]